MKKRKNWTRSDRRKIHHLIIRRKIKGDSERPRITIFFSLKWITCQVINDCEHKTIIGASVKGKNIIQSTALAKKICHKIKEEKSLGTSFYFDRSGYKFSARIRAFTKQFMQEGLTL